MKSKKIISSRVAVLMAVTALGTSAWATTVTVGTSGKTYASSAVNCAANPDTGEQSPVVEVGLFNPTSKASATVSLNGAAVATVTAAGPAANVWLADGNNTVVATLSKKTADSYTFAVQAGICALPDTAGNTLSSDGTLEYAASGKSYATVTPGCALNPATGLAQPYVHLVDNGGYLLNVSVNGVPLTQLSTSRLHTPVFLSAGQNVISAANGSLSIDYYIRDGGEGACTLP
jgi:streptogramin lyase